MNMLLMGILGVVLAIVVIFFYLLMGNSFLRIIVEMTIAVGLAYGFLLLGVSEFMAYIAAGLTLAMIFFVRMS
ncbi:MAG: hypothetical protein GOV00_01535 [Candidatus Altiarchaeota archaeon]|nr:hypothetical protein [Candidatus Altiarchaeota archaeon]